MKLPLSLIAITISIFWASATFASDIEKLTTLDDQTSVAVTIYNDNLALVKDQRTITLDKGFNNLAFRGVSARIRPETALLRSLNSNNQLHVLEQNFNFDLLTPQKMLEKFTGKQVQLATINPATGIETTQKATILSTNSGITLKIGDKIFTNPQGSYIFDKVPDDLRDQPTLITQLTSSSDKQQTVELGYLTAGLAWRADYVAELNSNETQLDLTGWITLTNQSGTAYNNAKLQLVAGDVNQVQPEFSRGSIPREAMMKTMNDSPVAEESLFEYHLYSLNRPTDLADKQTKQVALLSANSVPVDKEFLLQGNNYYYNSSYGELGQKMKVAVFVEFNNTEKAHLGMPIPKGIVRVYKNDSKGNAQFVGEDRIDHTPKNENIRLKLGDAFDITADKKQTDFKKAKYFAPHSAAYESSYEIELKNAKAEPVTVMVREPVPGEWKILQENHPHTKMTSGTAQWQITIPAESKETLKYTILVQY
ncbi:MAG: hypothetical protein ACI9FO_000199 [Methylophagaceae bacterium]|jgi:hypothetical protein